MLTRHAIQWMPFTRASEVLLPVAWMQEAVPLVASTTTIPTNRCVQACASAPTGWGRPGRARAGLCACPDTSHRACLHAGSGARQMELEAACLAGACC